MITPRIFECVIVCVCVCVKRVSHIGIYSTRSRNSCFSSYTMATHLVCVCDYTTCVYSFEGQDVLQVIEKDGTGMQTGTGLSCCIRKTQQLGKKTMAAGQVS